MKYNYYEAMKNDIWEYIEEEVNFSDWYGNRDGLEEHLNDELWIVDSVTGNGSGSYTFSRNTACEYVQDNMNLCIAMIQDFGIDPATVGEKFMSEDWEYFDVSIRCYLLSSVINDILDEYENNGYFEEPEEENENETA